MIKLFSRHSMVVDEHGRPSSFRIDDLRADLHGCLRACGVTDAWVGDDICLVIEEQLEAGARDGEPLPRRADVDTLVVSVLSAAGYADVARAYQRRRNMRAADALKQRLSSWSADRVQQVLARTLAIPEGEAELLGERIAVLLRSFGFEQVSDEFIRQVGIHLVYARGDRDAGDRADLTLDDCLGGLGDAVSALMVDGVVRLHRVSAVLPRLRLDLDLARLAATLGPPPVPELVLWPRLQAACRTLVPVLEALRSALVDRVGHAVHHPGRVIVCAADTVLRDAVGLHRRGTRRAALAELHTLLQQELPDRVSFPLALTLRE